MRRISSPVFVGRVPEIAALLAAWQAATKGEPRAIVVGGEAGVGKTRLLAELTGTVEKSGGRVLVGASADFGAGGLPFGPIVEALRRLPSLVPPAVLSQLVGPAGPELIRLVPELAPDRSDAASASTDEFARARLFELLFGFLDRLSRDRPTLLVLEDLHWADASTREFLAFVVRNLRDERLLVVGTYRTDEVHRRHPLRPYLAELERSGQIQRLDLAPFEPSELSSQIEAIVGRNPGAEFTQRVFERSEGNPFYTEELLATGEADVSDRLPPALQSTMTSRFEQLPEPAQRLVRIAAVAGRRVDEALLAQVSTIAETALVDALREAVAQHILVPEGGLAADRYIFRHALLQEAVYADLLPGERIGLHRSIADALARRRKPGTAGDSDVAADLAHHWHRAHELAPALAASVEAGLAAERRYAFPDALTHFERALELWSAVDDPIALAGMDRISLTLLAARFARAAGNTGRAAALLRGAIEETGPSGEPIRVGVLQADLMISLTETGDHAGADAAIAAALQLIPVDPPTAQRAHALSLAGVHLALASRHREALPVLIEARDVAVAVGATEEELPSPTGLTATLGSRVAIALCIAYLGDLDESIRLLVEERRDASEKRHMSDVVGTYIVHAIILEAAGRYEEALSLADEGMAQLRVFALERAVGPSFQLVAAEALRHLGRWLEADEITRNSTSELARRARTGGANYGGARAARALLLVGMGRLDEAETEWTAAREAYPLGTEGAGVAFKAHYYSARAEAALQRSDPGQASSHVAEGLRVLRASGDMRWIGYLSALGVRAEADRAEIARSQRNEADAAHAREVAERVLDNLRAGVTKCLEEGTIFRREAPAHLALATAEFTRLSGHSDPAQWSAAARLWQEIGEPPSVAYSLYRQAEASLSMSRSRAEAARLLDEARNISNRLSAAPLREAIDSLASRARIKLHSQDASAPAVSDRATQAAPIDAYRLTPREREVLSMLATGRSDREIADALYISVKTASVHVSNIKGKLGVDHRFEAATLAVRLGVTGTAD